MPVYLPGRNLLLQPSFWLLVVILAAFDWMGITYYIRGEFYREKAKDYVGAAIATGVSEPAIMFRHILPNALTPVVSFAPFVDRRQHQRRSSRSTFSASACRRRRRAGAS